LELGVPAVVATQFDIGYTRNLPGQSLISSGTNPPVITRFSTSGVVADVGLGVRFWAHPHFAVGAVTLAPLTYTVTTTATGTPTTSAFRSSNFSLGLSGALVVLGLF
jgi:hypothetical protein